MSLFDMFSSVNEKEAPKKVSGVRVRMAPSPTGNLHVGTARTSLVNYLFAKHTGGTFVMRIEDTDRERSKPEFEKNIIDGLTWLGLTWDEFYRQSERTELYTAKLQEVIGTDKAYISKEPAKDDPTRTVEVVRLRNPGTAVTFTDIVRGEITIDTTDLGDFVIARSITDPLYHFAVVVDDGETAITHVIRGEDHISNTARQILILDALGYTRPQYVHLPLILAPDRSKMSKRHGATSVDEYRAEGFIPEGLVNFLALMGWNPGTEQELFSLEELASAFSLEKLQKASAVFNKEKLVWYNREHLKRLSPEIFAERVATFVGTPAPKESKILQLIQERSSTLEEAKELLVGGEFSFITTAPAPNPTLILPRTKDGTIDPVVTRGHIEHILQLLRAAAQGPFDASSVKAIIWPYAEEKGRGAVLWPMRVALTGKEKSPDPFTAAELLGKDETLKRLESAAHAL